MNAKRARLNWQKKSALRQARLLEQKMAEQSEREKSRKINAREFAVQETWREAAEGNGRFGAINAMKKVQGHILSNLGLPEPTRKRIEILEERRVDFSYLHAFCSSQKPIPRAKALLVLKEMVRYGGLVGQGYREIIRRRPVVGRTPQEYNRAIKGVLDVFRKDNRNELVYLNPGIIEVALMFNITEVDSLLGKHAKFYRRELHNAVRDIDLA